MKKVAILQSNYIPWKGYFDMINMVDEFILYDDMQFTKRDWRNRNLIKTPNGLQWLTIPVITKGKYYQSIKETVVSDKSWAKQHWRTITHNYSKAEYFDEYKDIIQETYRKCSDEMYLSNINYIFLTMICDLLNIKTKISWSMDYELIDGRTERLIGLCKSANATHYISGPAAKCYIDEQLFINENINLSYMDYSGYPEYPQLHGDFQHGVTILDLIFNTGPNALKYMRSFNK